MNNFAGLVLFLLTFALGMLSTQPIFSAIDHSTNTATLPKIDEQDSLPFEKSIAPEGVTVTYAGMRRIDEMGDWNGTPYLKFIVHNGTGSAISYSSQRVPYGAASDVLIDGNKQPEGYRCGSGASLYSVEPGLSAEFWVLATEFEIVPKKNAKISVGFFIRGPESDFSSATYSEPFILPQSFRNSIKDWRREVDRRLIER